MRSKNAAKALVMHLGYEVLVFALGIIFPRFIILEYGSEINGLTATITRVLSLINLIQAGAVGAAIFQMYKPVAENDYETQSAILYASRRFYNRITVVYFAVALIAGVFYSFHLHNETLGFIEILIAFLILAINGSGALLFNSICDIYVSSHQKKYYLTIAMLCEQIVRYLCLVIVLLLHLHFLCIYIAYLLGGVVSVAVNLYLYKKLSRGRITNDPKNKDYEISDRKYLMMSSVGSEAVTASPSIIITTFVSLVASSVFSVYAMVFTSMKTVLNSIQLSFSAIFGNLVKTSDDEHVGEVYSVIEYITIALGAVCAACVGYLLIPFIKLYTAGITDAEYLHIQLVIFVVAYTAIFAFRTSFSYVATVYGLFKQICRITLFFGILGIVVSALCVIFAGMSYVMCGLLLNQIGCAVSTLYVIKKNIGWYDIVPLLRRTLVMLLMASCALFVYFTLTPVITSWIAWVIYGVISFAFAGALWLLYSVLFERRILKDIVAYGKKLLAKRKLAG
ncbi:MAG: oligosaccharide flippase family protein [Clostridia bacterium]|nr:oligosaccharide flippase family protein [Clostridia bacterium]